MASKPRAEARQTRVRAAARQARTALPAATAAGPDWSASPASRPLQHWSIERLRIEAVDAMRCADGARGAHCVHEAWMRGDLAVNVERQLQALWASSAAAVPDWLPMQYVEWLPLAYEVAARFQRKRRGRSHLYLVLLDYRDSPPRSGSASLHGGEFGVYVGMSRYPAAQRFDQHKAGIRSAGAVLKRGLEVLTGPVQHLQFLARAEAADIEVRLAESLSVAGLFVKGGH
jgi:hypothetical protein